MFKVVRILVLFMSFTASLAVFADFAAQEYVPGPFQFGSLTNHATDVSQNISQCILNKDPVSGQIALQILFQGQENTIIYMRKPSPTVSPKPGVFVVKDESSSTKKLELIFDSASSRINYNERAANGKLLLSLVCHFSKSDKIKL